MTHTNPSSSFLDLRLFAHVLNDPDLTGSHLQGNFIAHTGGYFCEFLSRLIGEKITIPDISEEKKNALLTHAKSMLSFLKPIIELNQKISSLIQGKLYIKNAEAEKHLAAILQQSAHHIHEQFKKEKRVFFEGGWSGHVILYELRSASNGETILLVWNTGEGLNHHLYEETERKSLYSAKAYQFKSHNEADLKQYIAKVIEPKISHRIFPEAPTGENSVYQHALPYISFLDGKEIDPAPFVKEYIPEQWSGTCAWQVLIALCKNHGFKQNLDDEIYFELSRDALSQFTNMLQEKDWQNKTIQSELQFAIKNFSLLLKEQANKKIISLERQQQALELLQSLENKLKKQPIRLSQKTGILAKISTFQLKKLFTPLVDFIRLHVKFFTLGAVLRFNRASFKSNVTLTFTHKASTPFNPEKSNINALTTHMKALINQEKFSLKKIFHSIKNYFFSHVNMVPLSSKITEMEELLLQLPLSPDFWKKASHDELLTFLPLLAEFVHKYSHLCKTKDATSFPERTLAAYNATALSYVIGNIVFSNNEEILSSFSAKSSQVLNDFSMICDNPYFTLTHHSHLIRKNEIQKILKDVCSKFSTLQTEPFINLAAYNDELLSKHLAKLKFYLIPTGSSKYLLQKIKVLSQPGVYYAFHKIQWPSVSGFFYFFGNISKKFPELEKNIQFYFSHLILKNYCKLFSNNNLNIISSKKASMRSIWNRSFINWDQNDKEFGSVTPPSISGLESSHDQVTQRQIQTLHPINGNALQNDLEQIRYKILPNKLEVNLYSSNFSAELDLRRRLQNLRSSSQSQVMATTEFIKSNLHELLNADYQHCIFMHLFQTGLVSEEILHNPDGIHFLIDLIQDGLVYYQGNNSYLPCVFLFKINCFLHQYLVSVKESAPSPQLDDLIKRTNHLCFKMQEFLEKIQNKENKTSYDHEGLSQLYQFKLIELETEFKLKNSFTVLQWDEFFKVNYLAKKFKFKQANPFVHNASEKAEVFLVNEALKLNLKPETILPSLLKAANISTPPNKFKGSFPNFSCDQYIIQLANGTITKSGRSSNALPMEIYQNSTFKDFFGDRFIEAEKLNDISYEFTVDHHRYRVALNQDYSIVLQRFLNMGKGQKWYELATNPTRLFRPYKRSKILASFLISFLSKFSFLTILSNLVARVQHYIEQFYLPETYLPHTLGDNTVHIWQSKYGSYVITDKKSQKRLVQYSSESNQLHQFNSHEKLCAHFIPLPEKYRFFTAFEDIRFIEATTEISTGLIHIALPRYGIHFKADNTGKLIFQENKRYHLLTTNQIPVNHFNSTLVLAHNKYPNDPSKHLYLVPKQTFIASDNPENDFYQVKLDIHNRLACPKPANDEPHPQNMPARFNFHQQEKYAVFTENNGLLQAQKTEDAFFAAYLYFSQKQPEKGIGILKEHIHQFSGKLEELDTLFKIIHDTPMPSSKAPKPSSKATDSTTNGPAYTAMRLMVGLIIMNYFKKEEKLLLQENTQIDRARYNSIDGIRIAEFNDTLETLMKRYLKMGALIPKALRLNSEQLLSIAHSLKETNTTFSLSVYQKRKTLKLLTKESQYLESLQQKSGLNLSQTERLKQITKKLTKIRTLIPCASHLSNITVQATIIPKEVESIYKLKDRLTPFSFSSSNKLEKLDLTTSDSFLATHFFAIFIEATQNNAKKIKLKQYITNKLIATHSSNEQIRSLLVLLNAMLEHEIKTNEIITAYKNEYFSFSFTDLTGVKKYHYDIIKALIETYQGKSIDYVTIEHKKKENNAKALNITPPVVRKRISATLPVQSDVSPVDAILQKTELLDLAQVQETNPLPSPAPLFESNDSNLFVQSLFKEANDDYIKGIEINANTRAQHQHTLNLLSNVEKQEKLQDETQQTLSQHLPKWQKLEQDILTLANRGCDNASEQILWQTSFLGKTKKILSIHDLCHYFAANDIAKLAAQRQLSLDEANKIYSLFQEYLITSTHIQQLQRIKQHLDNIRTANKDKKETAHLICRLGELLREKRCYNSSQYPDILLFEFLENKLLRPEQFSVLLKFMEQDDKGRFKSKIIPLIPGWGKSKVLTPILVKMRANGTNLTILEVPPALFETNLRDLQAMSERIYGQKVFPFLFHRNKECSDHYFYQLKHDLRSIIVNKGYILTTKQSMDSLMLKYIELLTTSQQNNNDKSLKHLDEIINLIRHQGDVIIDEVDLTLNPKDQLIYTLEEGISLNAKILSSLTLLYDFCKEIQIVHQDETYQLHDMLSQKSQRSTKEIQTKLLSQLANKLITANNSPIQGIIAKLNHNEQKDALGFLQGTSQAIPPCIMQLPLDERDILSVYKAQITKYFSLTLNKDCHVHFGLPKDQRKVDLEREIAIPYAGNNTPNENAKFQDQLVTINYTIQAQLNKELSAYLCKKFLTDFKTKWDFEKVLNLYATHKTFSVENEFTQILQSNAITLDKINFDNINSMNAFSEQFKSNAQLKSYCLTHYVLPAILSNPESLVADTQNHIELFRSSIGFTGTDYNYRTFHSNITRDNTDSIGTDGQTLDHLLRNPLQQNHLIQHNGFKELLDLLKSHPKSAKIHALIDSGALFKGIANREVANLLSIFYQNNNQAIQYILFFNDKNQLCALESSLHPENEEPIVLGTSENIAEHLHCSPENYVTYYDQKHTTGVDIKQADESIGLVTVNEHNTQRDLIQAAGRLRDLKGTQRAEFVILPSLITVTGKTDKQSWTTKAILNQAFEVQKNTLMKEAHLTAAFAKIHNTFKANLIAHIQSANNLTRKMALAKAFKEMLYDKESLSLFEKFAPSEQSVTTQNLLNSYCSQQTALWRACINKARIRVTRLQQQELSSKNQVIINEASVNCEPIQKSNSLNGSENEVIAQPEAQSEKQQEKEQETEGSPHKPDYYMNWVGTDWDTWQPTQHYHTPKCLSLESVVATHPKARNWQFNANILVSENFANTYYHQNDKINHFKKTGYFVLNLLENQDIKQILITQQEASEIVPLLQEWQKNNHQQANSRIFWIETHGGAPFFGNRPDAMNPSEQYKQQREQIHYFNGDVPYLISDWQHSAWFKNDTADKLQFLESDILVNHPSKATLLPILKFLLEGKQKNELNIPSLSRIQPITPQLNNARRYQTRSATRMINLEAGFRSTLRVS